MLARSLLDLRMLGWCLQGRGGFCLRHRCLLSLGTCRLLVRLLTVLHGVIHKLLEQGVVVGADDRGLDRVLELVVVVLVIVVVPQDLHVLE